MTAEHAHGIDTGGDVVTDAEVRMFRLEAARGMCSDPRKFGRDYRIGALADALLATRASAADAVLAEARRLCCGNNPSAHHAASAKHSERMAFAGDLARAVRHG